MRHKLLELVGALGVGSHGWHFRSEYRAGGANLISDHADATAPSQDPQPSGPDLALPPVPSTPRPYTLPPEPPSSREKSFRRHRRRRRATAQGGGRRHHRRRRSGRRGDEGRERGRVRGM
uniref:Uncharacterized protein n=1 Tax=Arundo donax TaxID=35708 RepID=A0A0A9CMQ1_ARUDO